MSRLDKVIHTARSNLNGRELMEGRTYRVFRNMHAVLRGIPLTKVIRVDGNSNRNVRYNLALLITEGCVCLG